jgi:hypothetical protein
VDELRKKLMLAHDEICMLKEGRKDFAKLCLEHGLEEFFLIGLVPADQLQTYIDLCGQVYAKWHTTDKFKVGDKVYVVSGWPCETYHIRATVTEVSTDGWGYHLRAFRQDLPGLFLFNIWDKDLIPRTGRKQLK